MKRIALLLSVIGAIGFASTSHAGSLSDPVVDKAVIVEDTTRGSSGTFLVIALAHLILIPILD